MTNNAVFTDFNLNDAVLKNLAAIGYEQPSPIQEQSIPVLLRGDDILGVAQTGTGKTAAFALPVLSQIDLNNHKPQVLVLTPTRELAIQVAEAFQKYASGLPGFHVLPIYGGQSIGIQLKQLRRGAQVIVGTPGRVMDHIRRKALNLSEIHHIVLDEADEMLRMGFIEDVTWILEHTPKERQTALFSATMPKAIQSVAEKYLNDPVKITIESKTTTVENIEQQAWLVKGVNKLDALTRILEIEKFDGIIIFVRTKTATVELAEKLEARGHASAPLNGDMNQTLRERTVDRLKSGRLDIIVATDVAARGIDVPRVSHVINYDIPYDIESYVHRIGRTGRAGRSGKAILFVAPREKRLLHAIERATRQTISFMQLPSREQIVAHRKTQFKQRVIDVIANENLDSFDVVIEELIHEHQILPEEIAKALAFMAQDAQPIGLPPKNEERFAQEPHAKGQDLDRSKRREDHREKPERDAKNKKERKKKTRTSDDIPMDTYRLEVGKSHGAGAKDIVGAIANEIELDPEYIGHIVLNDEYSTVELPCDMPKEIFNHLKKVRIRQQRINISLESGNAEPTTNNLDFLRPTTDEKPKHKKRKVRKDSSKKKKSK